MDIRGIDYLGIERVFQRGSAKILVDCEDVLLIYDTISKAFFLACEDDEKGISVVDSHIKDDCRLLMAPNVLIGKTAYERYGFSEKLECYQVAYYGEKPVCDGLLSFRTAESADIDMLTGAYHMLCDEDIKKIVNMSGIVIGYYQDCPVGFIGEHLEGSMGILYVFPEYRNKGIGTALQKYFIAKTIDRGFIPFGQVEKHNLSSLNLQRKIGMTISDNLIVWMWR